MTHIEVIENKETESIIQALTRLSCIFGPPSHETVDKDAAEIQALRESEYVTELEGKLYYHNGFSSTVVPVGCHARNGAAEIRVKAAKRLLGSMNLTYCELTAMDLQTLAYQAMNIINNTPLGAMQKHHTSEQLCSVTPMDFCMVGGARPILKTPLSFPSSINAHFLTMQATWNAMIKIHTEIIIPLLLPLPKWESETRSEKINEGDLIYMKRKEQSSFSPCYTWARVEKCHTSLDGLERTLTVKYIGPEILRRE